MDGINCHAFCSPGLLETVDLLSVEVQKGFSHAGRMKTGTCTFSGFLADSCKNGKHFFVVNLKPENFLPTAESFPVKLVTASLLSIYGKYFMCMKKPGIVVVVY